MIQRIREVEREMKYEEYAGREGDIVTGIIQQSDSRYTLLDLGRVEALLPQAEQVPYERPEPNTRLKAYIVEVRKTAKGPQIVVSRTHPGLIKRLFELEVPEIADGVVEIKACAREPGHRTKIAVWSNDHNVDPVGACVGARGARVRMVVNELRGEKIDIVPFSDDPDDFVAKALSPAKVKEVRIDEDDRHRRGDRPRLPAVAGHRQGGPERPPRRPAHRLAGRHQERDPAGRGGGLPASEDWAEGEWVVDAETGEQVWQPAEGGAGHLGRGSGRRASPSEPRPRPRAARPPRPARSAEATAPAEAARRPSRPRPTTPAEAAAVARPTAATPSETPADLDAAGGRGAAGRARRRDRPSRGPRPTLAGPPTMAAEAGGSSGDSLTSDRRARSAPASAAGAAARQPELVRVVAGADGIAVVGRTLPGRGAWLCAARSMRVEAWPSDAERSARAFRVRRPSASRRR